MSTLFKDVIENIHLNQLITIQRSIARDGVLDEFTNDLLIHEFRFKINATSEINLLSFTFGNKDFALLPNLKIEIDDEDNE